MRESFQLQILGIVLGLLLSGCEQGDRGKSMSESKKTFAAAAEFVGKYQDTIVLESMDGLAKVLVVPSFQGRVLTSTASGDAGASLGWINYDLIASGKIAEHINAFGGEDRFWLGPEGGQFAIFFKPGDPFDLEHWQTPPPIDSEPYEIVAQSQTEIHFRKRMQLTNYSRTTFDLQVDREVILFDAAAIAQHLDLQLADGIKAVAFETRNAITNTGQHKWEKVSGLLSIWILGMFDPSTATTVVIPLRATGSDSNIVNDDYFGKVPTDRLVVRNNFAFFNGDGKYRSKIGVPPSAARPVMGSYDAINRVLTVVQFSFDSTATDYVNSAWALQDDPYEGDVANSYNDGPPRPGAKPLGPFYELESSSAAKALPPGERLEHTHRTLHFTGTETDLDKISHKVLGIALADIKTALK